MPLRSLAVFCGSKDGNDPAFRKEAMALGKIFALHHITLVYGGGNVGLMGAIANEVMLAQGKVIGVIPQVLVKWERQHQGISELFVVEDMHARKKMMYDLCDAAVILPGGFGTLDELFEMVTWNQLSIHDKHIYILNSTGFYDHLVAHIQQMQNSGFLYEAAYKRLIILQDVAELVPFLLS